MLKIYTTLEEFEPWSGAIETYYKIRDERELDALDNLLADLYPSGISETKLNDILWFESEWLYDMLGIDYEKEE